MIINGTVKWGFIDQGGGIALCTQQFLPAQQGLIKGLLNDTFVDEKPGLLDDALSWDKTLDLGLPNYLGETAHGFKHYRTFLYGSVSSLRETFLKVDIILVWGTSSLNFDVNDL
jgi:hypothetical protein